MSGRIDERVNTVSRRELLGFDTEVVNAQREIDRLTTDLAAARGIKSGVFKRAKKAGADVEALRTVIKLRQMEVDERNRLRENEDKYADWLGVELWRAPTAEQPQGAMFEDVDEKAASEANREALITTDGYNTRRARGVESRDENPHPAGSREHQVWAQAWGAADRDWGGKPDGAKVANAAPRKAPNGAAKPAKKVPAKKAKAKKPAGASPFA